MANALRASIFQDLEAALIENLVAHSTFKNFKKGEVLFREGDEGYALYVIRKGSLKISRMNEKGVDVTQKYLPAGHFVGEMALLKDGTRRNATVSAAVACETIVINKEQLLQLLRESPEAKARIEKKERK